MWDPNDLRYSVKGLLSLQGNAARVHQEKNIAWFPHLCIDFSQLMHCLHHFHLVLSPASENLY